MQEIFEFLKSNTDVTNVFIAIFSLGMSFSAIMLGVLSLLVQRQHNFKSLTPIAEIRFYDYENQIAVRIANAGIGPLRVESFVATNGKEERANLISWMPIPPKNILWDTYFEQIKGITIRPNEEAAIIRLTGEMEDQQYIEFRNKIRSELSKLIVRVSYRDIYNRLMPSTERSLEWFGNHCSDVSKHKQRPRQ